MSQSGIDREVSDAIVDYIDERQSELVTDQKLELELSKLRLELKTEMADLRGEIRTDMANLRTEFAEYKSDMTRLYLGTSGVIGLLIVAMRFLPG